MATVYFVTEDYLKRKTPITKNVEASEIVPFIDVAAQTWMQNILGTVFFEDLLTKYNDQTLSSDEENLVKKMQPAIAWRSATDCVIQLTYQLKNKGLQKQNGDNSESVELDEMGMVSRHYEEKAEFYEDFVFKHLKKNKDLFPVYTSDENKDDSELEPNKDETGSTDMFFV